jgi:hypothetical protein
MKKIGLPFMILLNVLFFWLLYFGPRQDSIMRLYPRSKHHNKSSPQQKITCYWNSEKNVYITEGGSICEDYVGFFIA